MPDVSILEVILHDRLIGTLTLLPNERTLFAFTEDYINNPDRDTLSLSFKDSFGELITDIAPTRGRVPPFFANLLPEGHLRDYLAKQAGVNAQREFFLLWVLGQDLPGGLIIRPTDGEAWPPNDGGDGHHGGAAASDIRKHALRFSLAGVQLKFSAVMAATGGLTIPTRGVGGEWIVKLPSSKFNNVPENEFSMMSLAKQIGIDIPDIRLIATADIDGLPEDVRRLEGRALAIKRFDRNGAGRKIHMEDFAQVFGLYPEKKYTRASYRNIAEVIWIETGEAGILEFIRRFVFNTLIGNADMHLKNWSLIYPDGKQAVMAPGYDFVSTIAYPVDNAMALNFLRTKDFKNLTFEQFEKFAAKARLPRNIVMNEVRNTLEAFQDTWAREKNNLELTNQAIQTIDEHVEQLPLT